MEDTKQKTSMAIESIISRLEKRNKRLAQILILITSLFLASSFGWIMFAYPKKTQAQESAPRQVTTDSILRVRGLVVVDEKGIERVWIGAPGIDPMLLGKRINRADSGFSGILMFDGQGTERSGYGTGGDGTVFLTLDELGRQVATFSAQPLGGVSLTMNNSDDNKQKTLTMGASPKGSYLKLSEQNKVIFQQPIEEEKDKK